MEEENNKKNKEKKICPINVIIEQDIHQAYFPKKKEENNSFNLSKEYIIFIN